MLGIGDGDEEDCPQSHAPMNIQIVLKNQDKCVIVPTCNYRLGAAGTLKAER